MNEKLTFLKNRYVSQCDVCDSEKIAEFLHPMKCSDFCEVCSFRGCLYLGNKNCDMQLKSQYG